MENLVQPKQFLLFAFQQARHGNSGPTGDYLGDFVGCDFLLQQTPLCAITADLGFVLLELLLELRDLPVLVFGNSRQVSSALDLFHFGPGQFKGGAKFLLPAFSPAFIA